VDLQTLVNFKTYGNNPAVPSFLETRPTRSLAVIGNVGGILCAAMSKRNRLPRKQSPRPAADGRDAGGNSHFRQPRDSAGRPGARPSVLADGAAGGPYWLYGSHAVKAALGNPHRRLLRLLLAEGDSGDAQEIRALCVRPPDDPRGPIHVETADRAEISRLLPDGAVHQGVAAMAQPLAPTHVEDLCDRAGAAENAVVVVLDQVTDPHNVGAILRSAAAFGALAVVLTDRNAPPETGALAKSASGALELVPLIRVTNLVRALDQFKQAGFWCAGLAAEGQQTLAEAKLSGRVVLVLGSEGEGLRRLTRERCDLLVRLPTGGPIGHLNVSNAAAVGLYELAREGSPTAAVSDRNIQKPL
jgi:23S rRNA (guanosine2251-2'-O)-methyltransferase